MGDQTSAEQQAAPALRDRSSRRKPARPRRRASVTGVIGELLITAGVVAMLYVAWQLWIGDFIYGAQRNAEGLEISEQWAQQAPPVIPEPTESDTSEETAGDIEPPVLAEPADTEVFGVMRVPRFGEDYAVPMAGGVTRAGTLDPIGIGHYPGSPMPGETGNFAVAAHRTTYGKPFNQIADLQVGDAIVVEVEEGWYTYRFRTLEYVTPSEVDVLAAVPQKPEIEADGKYITMTSCSPMYSLAERIVAYGVFESFTPRDAGMPEALTEGVSA
ncbi:class E sortase [Microbacterium sp. SSW1-59]|uniref:class E sortase n=1 Tax=Microbacterium xanthum TaxID=3079794 RepID=UPI002AD53DDB|nr:class E sortase [Microbacterium sp. SSW1-59]MDZ8200690.1 class E sortase [Microbacterium sp. SSW1-59]